MSAATIRVPAPLRSFTGGAAEVSVDAPTVRAALLALETRYAGATARVLDERGELRSFVNLFVDRRNVKSLGGLDSALHEGAVLSIVPAVAGGVAEVRR